MAAKRIADGLWMIPTGAVNTYLIDDPGGCVLVDAGFPDKVDEILRGVAAAGKQPGDVCHILLTHCHPDHIGSLAAVQRATGAAAYIHPADHAIAAAGTGFRPMTITPGLMNWLIVKFFIHPPVAVEPGKIDNRVDDGQTLPIVGGVTAVHAPGHCAGQLCYLWPRHGGVLFAADACMNTMGLALTVAYEDRPLGERSLGRLAGLDFQIACFGHGKPIVGDAAAAFRRKFAAGV